MSLCSASGKCLSGESAFEAVNLAAGAGGHDWVLSPIAEMTTMDVFSYIGQVIAGRIECYDRFNQLVEIYRDMNGGDCMVNVYLAGKQSERPRVAIGQAAGHVRASRDSSAEHDCQRRRVRLAQALNDLRNYIKARHFDPSARCWLARTIDKETGTIKSLRILLAGIHQRAVGNHAHDPARRV
ncbi:hypothetical protein EJJ20_35120 (plasmid) [Pseudomonas poae]|nr:hypothetical protein EJJ20_35120 [Pseudomonas poae]